MLENAWLSVSDIWGILEPIAERTSQCPWLPALFGFYLRLLPITCSCLGEQQEGLQLVDLWHSVAPHGPQPALRQPQCDPACRDGAPPPAVPLRADLVNGGASDLVLVVELVEAVRQVVHCARAQVAARPPGLVYGVLWPLGSDADAIAGGGGGETEREGEKEKDINSCTYCLLVPIWNVSVSFVSGLLYMLFSLPGMWNQSIPDLFWYDKLLRLWHPLCRHAVKMPPQSALHPHA